MDSKILRNGTRVRPSSMMGWASVKMSCSPSKITVGAAKATPGINNINIRVISNSLLVFMQYPPRCNRLINSNKGQRQNNVISIHYNNITY